MKRILLAGLLALSFALPGIALGTSGVLAATPASQPAHISASPNAKMHCPNYQNGPNCVVVPPSGVINNVICGIHFVGTAKPGTTIECVNLPLLVKLPCQSVTLPKTGGAAVVSGLDAARALKSPSTTTCCETGFSISIHGTHLHLKVPGARIFKFNPTTGQSHLVSAITGSGGEFTIIFGACPSTTVTLPQTGAGVASREFTGTIPTPTGPNLPMIPLGIGFLLILGGAAVALRSKRVPV
ncbi:MAG TPA: hypothetical protein VG815_08275 [Chloroflexota bacterium]|jgi:hypothetical protein|nr:hypothetical protein [Chloroflexota bacterium]